MKSDNPQTQTPPEAAPPAQPTHKITIYGATSFVAHYVIEYLLSAISTTTQPILITFAGRNQTKLQSLLDSHSSLKNKLISIDTFAAECSNLPSLTTMAQRTDVIINCAGPYAKYGSLVVEACAATGTDYVDITGEVDWAADMKKKFHSAATTSGARIVSLCGFDSIPSDVAVFECVAAAKKEWGEDVVGATTWHACRGLMNGGTLHTALDMTVDFWNCVSDGSKYRRVPFLVHDPIIPSLLFLVILGLVSLVFKLPYIGKRLALLLLPPGTGSSDVINRAGYADIYAKVTTSSGNVATTHIKFQGDPGNLVTAQCVVESALSLVLDKAELRPNKTGFGTPAEMLGRVLINRFLGSQVRKVVIETTVGGEELSDKKNQ